MVLLQAAQWYLKETAMERGMHHPIVTVSLPAADAIWHKKEKELNLQGRFFDVKHYQVRDGRLTATGYYDEKEEHLVSFLSKLAGNKNNTALLQLLLVLQVYYSGFLLLQVPTIGSRKIRYYLPFMVRLPHPFYWALERPPGCCVFFR